MTDQEQEPETFRDHLQELAGKISQTFIAYQQRRAVIALMVFLAGGVSHVLVFWLGRYSGG